MVFATLHTNVQAALPAGVGSQVANKAFQNSVLHALLRTEAIKAAHMYTDSPERTGDSATLTHGADGARVSYQHLAQLPVLAEQQPYVWACTPSDCSIVTAMRAGLTGTAFPISVFAEWPLAADGWSWLAVAMLQLEACDSFLVQSHAAAEMLSKAMDSTAQWLRRKGASGFRRPQVVVVPPCVDTSVFGPGDRKQAREAFGLRGDRLVVLCPLSIGAGRRGALDSVLVLVDEIASRCPEITLLLAGTDGRGFSSGMDALARELNSRGQLVVEADVADHRRPLLYAASDLYLSPDDGIVPRCDLTVLEAMASGLPVVTSGPHASAGIIESGVSGYLVPSRYSEVATVMMGWLGAGSWAPQFLADRTIVDMRSLREALDALISRPELRAAVGQRARTVVATKYSLAPAAKVVADTWTEQRSQWVAMAGQQPSAVPIDYAGVLNVSGCDPLTQQAMVDISDVGRACAGDELRGASLPGAPPLLESAAAGLLSRISEGPKSIGDAVSIAGSLGFEAVIWLLKRGYLCVMESSEYDGTVVGDRAVDQAGVKASVGPLPM